jgi:YD repeat-containing protein
MQMSLSSFAQMSPCRRMSASSRRRAPTSSRSFSRQRWLNRNLLQRITRPTITEGTPVYSFVYDSKGKLTDATGPTGIVTHSVYDSAENLTSSILDYSVGSGHLNLTTGYGYDPQGDVTSTTDPRTNVTTSIYDLDRRKTEDDHHDGGALANLNAATQSVYDEIGRVTDTKAGTAFSGTTVTTWLTTKHTTYTPTSKVAT